MNPTIPRRQLLRSLAAAAMAPALPDIARAQSYPSRPVKIIVGNAPGGGADLQARFFATFAAERLGQPFVVENRAGAAFTIAAEAVVRAPPDGYTLLITTPAMAITATLYDKLSYDYLRDTAQIGGTALSANVLVAHPSTPFRTIPELLAYAKANPGKLSIASGGTGTAPHLGIELFRQMAGASIAHIPYRGDPPALADIMAGHVPLMLSTMAPALELVRTGKLKAIAVTSPKRSSALPEIPSIGETLEGFQVTTWSGLATTRGVPSEIIERLNKTLNEFMSSPDMVVRNRDVGSTLFPDNTPENFTRFITEETALWAKVIKAGNIKAE